MFHFYESLAEGQLFFELRGRGRLVLRVMGWREQAELNETKRSGLPRP
jgi:hypothetical protein